MLIPGKSHSRDESRNSPVSIETLDFDFGVGSPAGGAKGGGAITGRTRHRSRLMTGPHRRLWTIKIASSGAPKTAGGRVRGSATGEAQHPSAPGRRAGESSPPSVGRRERDGRVKRRAAAGSPAPWRQKADVQRDGGTRSPTGCRVRETTGPLSDAAGRSADIAGGRHI